LVGLLMEFLAEKPRFANISAFRFWERIKRWGELIVIIGIVVEIIVGGMFARDEWENSPWNGNISDISADVYFEVKGTNSPDFSRWANERNIGFLTLCNRSPEYPRMGSTLIPLNADSFTFRDAMTSGTDSSPNRSYWLHFGSQGMAALFAGDNDRKPIREIKSVSFIVMQMKFLPKNTEVLGGTVLVVVNGKIPRMFQVLPQVPHAEGIMGNLLIATNEPKAEINLNL